MSKQAPSDVNSSTSARYDVRRSRQYDAVNRYVSWGARDDGDFAKDVDLPPHVQHWLDTSVGNRAPNSETNSRKQMADFEKYLIEMSEKYRLNFSPKLTIAGDNIVIVASRSSEKISLDAFHSYRQIDNEIYCQVCHKLLSGRKSVHNVTESHVRNITKNIDNNFIRKVNPDTSHCLICNEIVSPYSAHAQTDPRHITIKKRVRKNKKKAKKNPKLPKTTLCGVCDRQIDTHNFLDHVKSKKHLSNAKILARNKNTMPFVNNFQKIHTNVATNDTKVAKNDTKVAANDTKVAANDTKATTNDIDDGNSSDCCIIPDPNESIIYIIDSDDEPDTKTQLNTKMDDKKPNLITTNVKIEHLEQENFVPNVQLEYTNDGSIVVITPSGYKEVVSEDVFHSFRETITSVHCQSCMMFISKDTTVHRSNKNHVKLITQPVDDNLLRKINDVWSHCLACNDMVLTNTNHVQLYHKQVRLNTNNTQLQIQYYKNCNVTLCYICNLYINTNEFLIHINRKHHLKLLESIRGVKLNIDFDEYRQNNRGIKRKFDEFYSNTQDNSTENNNNSKNTKDTSENSQPNKIRKADLNTDKEVSTSEKNRKEDLKNTENNTEFDCIEDTTNFKQYIQEISSKFGINLDMLVFENDILSIITPKGLKKKVSVASFHSYKLLGNSVQCQICQITIKDGVDKHNLSDKHLKLISGSIDDDFARKINNAWRHCIVCNEMAFTGYDHVSLSANHKLNIQTQDIPDVQTDEQTQENTNNYEEKESGSIELNLVENTVNNLCNNEKVSLEKDNTENFESISNIKSQEANSVDNISENVAKIIDDSQNEVTGFVLKELGSKNSENTDLESILKSLDYCVKQIENDNKDLTDLIAEESNSKNSELTLNSENYYLNSPKNCNTQIVENQTDLSGPLPDVASSKNSDITLNSENYYLNSDQNSPVDQSCAQIENIQKGVQEFSTKNSELTSNSYDTVLDSALIAQLNIIHLLLEEKGDIMCKKLEYLNQKINTITDKYIKYKEKLLNAKKTETKSKPALSFIKLNNVSILPDKAVQMYEAKFKKFRQQMIDINNLQLECQICSKRFSKFCKNNIVDHFEGKNHKRTLEQLLKKNRIKTVDSGFFCDLCHCDTNNFLEHIYQNVTHVKLKLYSDGITLNQLQRYMYEQKPSDGIKMAACMEVYKDLLEENKVRQVSDVVFQCDACSTWVMKEHEIKHVFSDAHKSYLEKNKSAV